MRALIISAVIVEVEDAAEAMEIREAVRENERRAMEEIARQEGLSLDQLAELVPLEPAVMLFDD